MSDTELSKRKAKIGIYLFNAEFLVANYIYVEGYCNYSCWEELYFRAFLMSEQELLQKNVITPKGLKSLAFGSTSKNEIDALTDAALYFSQCQISDQFDGYEKDLALLELVSKKDAIRKSVISVLKKKEDHPIYRCTNYYYKKALFENSEQYVSEIVFDADTTVKKSTQSVCGKPKYFVVLQRIAIISLFFSCIIGIAILIYFTLGSRICQAYVKGATIASAGFLFTYIRSWIRDKSNISSDKDNGISSISAQNTDAEKNSISELRQIRINEFENNNKPIDGETIDYYFNNECFLNAAKSFGVLPALKRVAVSYIYLKSLHPDIIKLEERYFYVLTMSTVSILQNGGISLNELKAMSEYCVKQSRVKDALTDAVLYISAVEYCYITKNGEWTEVINDLAQKKDIICNQIDEILQQGDRYPALYAVTDDKKRILFDYSKVCSKQYTFSEKSVPEYRKPDPHAHRRRFKKVFTFIGMIILWYAVLMGHVVVASLFESTILQVIFSLVAFIIYPALTLPFLIKFLISCAKKK